MPYFHFAGTENDPAEHVRKYDLLIENEVKVKTRQGIQLGDFSMYIIKKSFIKTK